MNKFSSRATLSQPGECVASCSMNIIAESSSDMLASNQTTGGGTVASNSISNNSNSSISIDPTCLPRFTLKAFYQSPVLPCSSSAVSECLSKHQHPSDTTTAVAPTFTTTTSSSISPYVHNATCVSSSTAVTHTGAFNHFFPSFSQGQATDAAPYFQVLCANSDGSSVCVASSFLSLFFFSPQHLLLQRELLHAHAAQITAISFFNRHPHLLASASQDASVRVWDLRCSTPRSCHSSATATATTTAAATTATAPQQSSCRYSEAAGHLQMGPMGSTDAEVWSVAIDPTDTLLAAAYKNGFSIIDIRCLSSTVTSCNNSSSNSSSRTVHSEKSNTLVNRSLHTVSNRSYSSNIHSSNRSNRNNSNNSSNCNTGSNSSNQANRRKKRSVSSQVNSRQQLRALISRVESHAESINYLTFHPTLNWLLMSAGEDGLVCCYDIRSTAAEAALAVKPSHCLWGQQQQGTMKETNTSFSNRHVFGMNGGSTSDDEEEAAYTDAAVATKAKEAIAVGCGQQDMETDSLCCCFSYGQPIRKMNIVGPQKDCLCVCSSTDDAALWQIHGLSTSNSSSSNSSSSSSRSSGGKEGSSSLCSSHSNSNSSSFNSTAQYSSSSNSNTAVSIEQRVEWKDIRMHPQLRRGDSAGYVVESFYDVASGRLFLLGGSVDGGLLMLHANLTNLLPAALFAAPPQCGHTAVVRGACTVGGAPTDAGSDTLLLLTCGEDGRLCAWKQESDLHTYTTSDKGDDSRLPSPNDGGSNNNISSKSHPDVFVWRGSHRLREGPSSSRIRPY